MGRKDEIFFDSKRFLGNKNLYQENMSSTSDTSDSSLQIVTYDRNKPLFNNNTSYIIDIFSAYGLCPSGLNDNEIAKIIDNITRTKKTFPFLQDAVQSYRYPYTIMIIAAKIGMFIPPRRRVGLDAYTFFIANIKFYEATFERAHQQVPNLYEIYMSNDRVGLLMKFRDEEILQQCYKFSRNNYSTRKEMIDSFIENNVSIYGQFSLENNSRTVYATKVKVISYQEGQQKLTYSTNEFLLLFDLQRGIVWKDPQGFLNPSNHLAFSRLSLHHLRQQILEKCGQWKNRDGACQYNGPPELHNILVVLENLLANDIRNDVSAYLGNPILGN